jgi:class 3 adenylate cyclase/tetratricopeptide (TPR) repeat protein
MENLDPEEARAIVEPLLRIMTAAVQLHEGYVVRTTGDGIFALFGAPAAYEDHPQRALHAASRMQHDLRTAGEQRRACGLIALDARIGVHTGEVVAYAADTSGKLEYRLVGHTANLAARLEALAPPGSIAVSDYTRQLCEGYFEVRPLGPVRVKGVSEPINVFEVVGTGVAQSHFDLSARRGLTRFVGRESELQQMQRALERATAGNGQIVAAVGEAGAGKSRLFHEFKTTIPPRLKLLEAHSAAHRKASAWLPLIHLLRSYFGIADIDDPAARRAKVQAKLTARDERSAELMPYLLHLLGIVDGPDALAQMDPNSRRRRTIEAIKQVLIRESLLQPLVIIFEDLHWIDDQTQLLLDALADSIANARVLLLLNYRPEYHHGWSNKSYYLQLRLTLLDDQFANSMLDALLSEDPELAPLKHLIVERTEGNPFFIEEMVRSLFEEGSVVRNGGISITQKLTELRLPATVQGILAARIDRLTPDQKELLQTLAVIGRTSSRELLRRVAPHLNIQGERLIGELQNAEFIYEQHAAVDTEYVFKHALTQEVAYESLLIERRKRLHELTGVALEQMFASRLEEHAVNLAYHYARTDNHNKAIEYVHLAGKQSARRGAHYQAIAHFRTALERLESLAGMAADQQRCEILLALADEQERAGEHLDAQQSWLAVVTLAKTQGAPDSIVAAAVGLIRLAVRVGIATEGLTDLLEDTLETVGTHDSAAKAQALCGLSGLLGMSGEHERADYLGEQGLAMSQRLGDRELLCRNMNLVAFGLVNPWSVRKLLSNAIAMGELARSLNDKSSEAQALDWMIISLLELGDVAAADRQTAAAEKLAEEVNEPFNQILLLVNNAARALMRGEFDRSEQLAQQALEIGRTLQTEAAAGIFGLQMFAIARERGELQQLEPVLQLFLKERSAGGAWRPGLALLYAELNRDAEARRQFDTLARADFSDIKQDALWLGSLAYLVDICVYLGDEARGRLLYDLLRPFDELNVFVGYGVVCCGAVSRYLGMLAALLQNWQEAERYFDHALMMNARMNAPVWIAHTEYQYARMLLARSCNNDRARAFEMLTSALHGARRFGMKSLEARVTAALPGVRTLKDA